MATSAQVPASDGVVLGIHLDIGHSSIGWAVTESSIPVVFRGCGTVLFQKDGCLASERRGNRRQRRHIRATRQRIARMRTFLAHLGVLSAADLERPGGSWPWKLAAEVLCMDRKLNWQELWDVLRWYGHNRGYDGNALWQRGAEAGTEDKETRKSIENAEHLMEEHSTTTMAETVCAVLGITPGEKKRASRARFKAKTASFPRSVVRGEVERILRAHATTLPGIGDTLVRSLLGCPLEDPEAWQAHPCPPLRLPRRYAGGLLFGQLVPRFDNRIIGHCPVSEEKRPLKSCPEFLEYRWAMQLANIRVRRPMSTDLTPLTAAERELVTSALRTRGYFTKGEFKKAVNEAAGPLESNLDDMLLHPDAEKALILYPALREVHSKEFAPVWNVISGQIQKRVLKRLSRGKQVSVAEIRTWLADTEAFDRAIDEASSKGKKKSATLADKVFKAEFPSGRAPYGRATMRKVVEDVMAGGDPRMEGGVLGVSYATASLRALPELDIDQETNNHLVRHRLRIVRRLVEELVEKYAQGNKAMIERITVEFNREVGQLSGMTAEKIAKELGRRLKSHTEAVQYAAEALGIPSHKLGGSLIRKVRIAMDLDWTCPYTSARYDIHQLRSGGVDLDHIIPRSQRTSDSLDSLVITFKAVNAWKTNATAIDFIEMHGGKPVPGMPNLSIVSPKAYLELVDGLKRKRLPHPDDQRRRDNRCKRMLTKHSDNAASKGFTPRDLTMTSHLVTLASSVIRDVFRDEEQLPIIRNIPGPITKKVRMSLDVLGALAKVNPLVLNSEGELKTKTEIRDISHLHHAVDAITLGLATSVVPVDGGVWALMLKRNLLPAERQRLESTGAFRFDGSGRAELRPLHPETRASIDRCLAECRVATHLSKSRHGATLEKTTWRVVAQEGNQVEIRQQSRDENTGIIKHKTDKVNAKRLLGITPRGKSKLQALKGAIVISDNYGVALDPELDVIPFHQVWKRIGQIKKRNDGNTPRILRNGMILRVRGGRYAGIWKIFSIKDDARAGVSLDIASPDTVRVFDKTQGHKRNVLLKTLLRNGLELQSDCYTGVPLNVPPPD